MHSARFRVFWFRRSLARGLASTSLLFSLLLLSSGAGAQGAAVTPSQEARTTFERGVEASREQHWEEARVQFERSLALLPKPSTRFNLALAYVKLGLGREALVQLDAFEQAASPSEHAAMLERAQVMRPQAQALVDSAQAKAKSGGNVLSSSEDGLSAEARQDVAEARANYAKGRDKAALAGFERAYKRSNRPELLYNIGVVADRLRNDKRAISAYDAFVEALPDAREAAVAQVRSESLRVALEREESAPKERPAEARSARELLHDVEATPPNLAGPRTMIATGSILAAASIGALVASRAKWSGFRKCIDSVKNPEQGERPCDNVDDIRDSRKLAVIGTIVSPMVLATGLVLVTVGAVKLSRAKHRSRESAFTIVPSFSERAATLTAVGSF